MPNVPIVQTSFAGGEWGTFAQSRIDSPHYKTAMETCLNGVPLEVGAWTRRSGTCHAGFTRRGKISRLFRYRFSWKDNDVILEVSWDGSNSWLRFWDGPELITEAAQTIASVTANTPAKFTKVAHGLSTGDDVVFFMDQSANANNGSILLGRVFTITKISNDVFTIADAVSGATFATSAVNFDSGVTNTFARVVKIALPFTSAAEVEAVRCVVTGSTGQIGIFAGGIALLLNTNHWPFAIGATAVPQAPAFPTFTSNTYAAVTDGPYLDTTVGAATASAATGSITFTASSPYPRETGGWVASDATQGSPIRIYSEPAQWDVSHAYSAGDAVTRGTWPTSDFFAAQVANTGVTPELNTTVWSPVAGLGQWTWAKITGVTNSHTVTATVEGPDIAYSSNIVAWLEGLWSDHWGYPSCGIFSSGRLWLNQSYLNGFFTTSVAGDYFNFAPTDNTGNPLDSSGIQYSVAQSGLSPIYWMIEDARGILMGLKNSEWLLSSGTGAEEAITQTNIKEKKFSALGSMPNAEPVRLGSAIAFLQASTKQVIEYIADTFSQKFGGRVLDIFSQHITAKGMKRLDQQASRTPIIWALDTSGNLSGCTYRRVSSFITEEPTIYGWHRHTLGTAYTVQDICSGYGADNVTETLFLETYDGSKYRVEFLMPLTDENRGLSDAWFLDACPGSWTGGTATTTRQLAGRDPSLDGGSSGLYFQGLYHLTGQTVTCFINGWNCGTYVVDSAGGITVAYGADPEGLCTKAALIAASGTAANMNGAGCNIDVNNASVQTRTVVPVVIGLPFTSKGRLLPPDAIGGQAGEHPPVPGEIRRVAQFSATLQNTTNAAYFGTDFTHIYPAKLSYDDQSLYTASQAYSGAYQDVIDDNPSLTGGVAWQNSSPYPMTVTGVTSFITSSAR